MERGKTILAGLLAGALLTLGTQALIRKTTPPESNDILAEVQGQVLTKEDLRNQIGTYLIPIENDEYAILHWGVEDWIQNRLLEKEAKAQGIPLEELYRKEIWSKVKVSYESIQEYYNKNKELFPQPLETTGPLLSQQLRQIEYAKIKEQYLTELRKKYNVKNLLKQPKSFVEGLAIPGAVTGAATAPLPTGKPIEIRSEIGKPPAKGPQDAMITMTEFADFHCPFCKKIVPTLDQVFKNYPGKIQFIFRHFPLSKTPGAGSFLTHEAAACAQEQGKFWEYHDAIFSRSETPQEADLLAMAKDLGLDEGKFQDCLKSGRYLNVIDEDVKEGQQRGVQGTPMVFLNDQTVSGAYPYEYFVNVVEGILHPEKAKAAPPKAPTPPAPVAPPPVVQFDDLEGKPTRGPEKAPVTLVEFSDFYCPFCQRVEPTLEQLEKNYPGKIRRVWRHYPLPFHTGSDRVHEASECAHEQGKFWPYHKKLFEKQGTPFDDDSLIRLAGELDLNKKKFEKCLKSGKYKELIQKEIARGGQVGVQGTPVVFVNGQLVSGAQPYESFEQIVKEELTKS